MNSINKVSIMQLLLIAWLFILAGPALAEDSPQIMAGLGSRYKILTKAPFSVRIRFDDQYEVLHPEDTDGWRYTDDYGNYVWKDEPVKEYLATLKEKYDSEPGKVRFTTHSGISKIFDSERCGWNMNIDASLINFEKGVDEGKITVDPAWNSGQVYTTVNGVGLNYIEVDISEQKVYLFKDGVNIFETDCVTGTAGYTDTTRGVYQVAGKSAPAVLSDFDKNGNKYEQPVDYWICFNVAKGQGLHDATWRGAFGGEIYKSWGSHGCVNLPPEAAERIYKEVYLYYPVIVY